MPNITVRHHVPVRRSFRVLQVAGMFDVPLEERLAHELSAEVPGLDEPWTIGVIVGPSGSGKTTLARAAFGALYEPPPWPRDRAIIDCLERGVGVPPARESGVGVSPARQSSASACELDPGRPEAYPTIKDLARVLCGVGLGSVPTWLKPYHVLSTGERFRADLARAVVMGPRSQVPGPRSKTAQRRSPVDERGWVRSLANTEYLVQSTAILPLIIDEFTSSLDRTVAQTTSAAVGRLLRGLKASLRLVALTCHDDVVPWLEPDWVLRLGGAEGPALSRGRLRRPDLRLLVCRVPQALWRPFARHHYLAGGLAASATCYAAWHDDVPVAFCAAVAALGWKQTKRITRLVTLPEFQGLGIGTRLAETVAAHETSRGNRVTITASHPAIVSHCSRSSRWRFAGLKKIGSTRQHYGEREIRCSLGRAVATFEFVAGGVSGEW